MDDAVTAESGAVLLYDFPLSICCQMARLALVEKGVRFETHHVDISDAKEQFEAWYLALNPKGVVPTLRIGDEITTDTIVIVQRVDARFDGPQLTPADAEEAERMRGWLRDLMAPRFGVLYYSRKLDQGGASSIVAGRGEMLARLLEEQPHAAELLKKRIEGNGRLSETLSDAKATADVVSAMEALVVRVDEALGERAFLVGEAYTLADAFCTAVLARFEMQGYAGWWEEGALPRVAAYYERMQARPSWGEAGVVNRLP